MANVCDLYIGNYELRRDIDEMRRQMNILLLERSILEIQLERCIQNMAEQRKEVARLHKEIFEWRDNYDNEDLKGNLSDIELKTKK